ANRRLQPLRYLHDCSDCFRLERLPGGACTHWKAPPFHGAHPITYIHLGLLVGEPDESTNESKIRRRPPLQRASLHRKARPILGLHLRLLAHVPAFAGRGRHATPLPRQPTLGPPYGPRPRTSQPDPSPTRHRPQHRTP